MGITLDAQLKKLKENTQQRLMGLAQGMTQFVGDTGMTLGQNSELLVSLGTIMGCHAPLRWDMEHRNFMMQGLQMKVEAAPLPDEMTSRKHSSFSGRTESWHLQIPSPR